MKPQGKLPIWRGFNLQNMYVKGSKNDKEFDEKDFRTISEWGFNFVRLPIDYRILIADNDWYKVNESAFLRLDKAVELGAKYNIHVCVNFHRAPGYTVHSNKEPTDLWTDTETQNAFAFLWSAVAERYKESSNDRVSLNLVNEPPPIDEAVHAGVMEKAAIAIRAKDPNRLIIADGREWGSLPSGMIRDLGMAQSTRGYYPNNISHYKAAWMKGADDFPAPVWPMNDNSVPANQWLWDTAFKQWDQYIENGGVMVGEWGAHNKTPHDVVLKWMEDNLKIFKEHGIGWALWNFDDSFGPVNSDRADVDYEDYNGYKLDRRMLELLQRY